MTNYKLQITNDKLNPKSQIPKIYLIFVIWSLIIFLGGCVNPPKDEHKGHIQSETKKILFYRNPMNPQITSKVFMKDEMGMDYIPVYEEEFNKPGVPLNSEEEKLIGVATERAAFRRLVKEIRTVGTIAYDPELYVAQQEYIGVLGLKDENLIQAGRKKLEILGLSAQQIEDLETEGVAQVSLILPQNKTWVYITVYEYELGIVKEGAPVEVNAIAFPAEKFMGKIVAISPVLDPMTRSAKARAEIENPGQKLKPSMSANVKIVIDLGTKLSVPQEAVLNTGKRTTVVVAEDGRYFSRDITLGQKAEGYYEVRAGLKEGEQVVTTANFLIDSEARLKSAMPSEHQH